MNDVNMVWTYDNIVFDVFCDLVPVTTLRSRYLFFCGERWIL
jgi:hypothetical protein